MPSKCIGFGVAGAMCDNGKVTGATMAPRPLARLSKGFCSTLEVEVGLARGVNPMASDEITSFGWKLVPATAMGSWFCGVPVPFHEIKVTYGGMLEGGGRLN